MTSQPQPSRRTTCYEVIVRRLCTGCDYHIRLFAKDAEAAESRAKDRARFAANIRLSKMQELNAKGIAVFRIVSCEISANQSRPIS